LELRDARLESTCDSPVLQLNMTSILEFSAFSVRKSRGVTFNWHDTAWYMSTKSL